MSDQPSDPARFFDRYPRFLETDELGSVADRLNARYLGLIHANRELIEGATVLDLASHDGRFSFAALQNGAAKVIGIEHGADLVEKCLANIRHYNVPSDRYEFLVGDIYDLIDQIERVDVVFCFGILYHVNSHLLLLTKIADLDPRTVIIDTNISLLEPPVIELRGPVDDGRPLQLGESVEGYPSRAALNAMLSSFGWKYDYFDWEESGLLDRAQMRDYLRGIQHSRSETPPIAPTTFSKMVVRLREQFRELVRPKRRNVRVRPPVVEHARVSVVVDCNRADFSSEERQRAVQMVLDLQRDRKTQRQTIIQVASKFGMRRQTLHSWVRQVERAAAQLTDVPHTAPIPDAIEIPDPLGTDAEAG